MTELVGSVGRPLRLHRIRLEASLINGSHQPLPSPVPCEVCGAPVYLLDVERWCEPGRRFRKVGELIGGRYVRHDCADCPAPDRPGVPRCEPCEDAMMDWVDGKIAEVRRLQAEADRHRVEAERLYRQAMTRLRAVR